MTFGLTRRYVACATLALAAAACGENEEPENLDDCDEVEGSVCFVECTDSDPCSGTIVCPAGFQCAFTCAETGACDDVLFDCDANDNDACSLDCGGASLCTGALCTIDGANCPTPLPSPNPEG